MNSKNSLSRSVWLFVDMISIEKPPDEGGFVCKRPRYVDNLNKNTKVSLTMNDAVIILPTLLLSEKTEGSQLIV